MRSFVVKRICLQRTFPLEVARLIFAFASVGLRSFSKPLRALQQGGTAIMDHRQLRASKAGVFELTQCPVCHELIGFDLREPRMAVGHSYMCKCARVSSE